MTFVKSNCILNLSSNKNVHEHKGGFNIANEIVFTELKFSNVSAEALAGSLGITKQTLMQLLRFELDEQEQIKMLWLINNLPKQQINEYKTINIRE